MNGRVLRRLVAFTVAALILAPAVLAGCGGNSPEGAVNTYLKAWQDMDWDALKASVAPQKRNLTKEQEELAKQVFEQVQVGFEGLKMETTYSKEDKKKATVILVEGKVSVTANILGEEKTEVKDVKDMIEEERTYATVEVDGTWYVDADLG